MNHILKALILCACVLAINCGVTGQEQDNSTLTKLQSQFKSQITQNEDGPLGLINRLFKFFQATEQQQQKDKIEQPVEQGNSTAKRNKRQAYGGGYGGPQGGYGGPQGGYGGPQGGYGGQQGGYGGPQGGYGGGGYGGYDDGPAPDFFYSDEFLYDYYDWVCSETNCQLCNILTAECCDPEVNVNCFLPDSCLNNPCLSGGTCITSRTIDNAFPDFICACLPGFTGKYCQLTNEYLLPPSALLGLGGPQGGYGGPQGGYGGPQGGYGQQAPQPNYGRAPQGYGGPAPYGGQQGGPAPYGGQQSGPAPYGAPQRGPAPGPYGGQQGGPVAPGPYGGQQGGPGPYGGQQGGPVAPGPYGGQQGPQRSGPVAPGPVGPAPYGSQGAVRTLSAKSTTWPGFDCNCQGKGYCAQVGTEENSEPEFFCICDNGTYGSRCDEGFKNPCADKTMLAKFAPIDRQIPGYYFIECKTMMPYVRKCENGKRFNPKTNMCQTVKQKPIPRPVQ